MDPTDILPYAFSEARLGSVDLVPDASLDAKLKYLDLVPYAFSEARLGSVDLLPPELWSLIFNHINKLSDICNLLLTCKLFNNIVPTSILEITDGYTLNMYTVKKFKSLRKISQNVYVPTTYSLSYLTKLKLQEINIIVDPEIKINNIYNFIKNNEFKEFDIIRTYDEWREFPILHTNPERKLIYKLKNNVLSVPFLRYNFIKILNSMKNSHIRGINIKQFHLDINYLDSNKYKLVINNIRGINGFLFNNYIIKPFTIEITNCIAMKKWVTVCFIPHKIICNYYSSTIEYFEIFLKTLKHNLPNANLEDVIYDQTEYLKNYEYMLNTYNLPPGKKSECLDKVKSMNVGNKPYKVI